jgi:hypothetical protein
MQVETGGSRGAFMLGWLICQSLLDLKMEMIQFVLFYLIWTIRNLLDGTSCTMLDKYFA